MRRVLGRLGRTVVLICLAVLLVAPWPGRAQVPTTIGYQGTLSDASGAPVTATLDMVFSLYDAPAAATPLWSETQSVTVTNGVFSVGLGEVTPFPANLFSAPRYLGVKVGTDTEMTPRLPFRAAPFAFSAEQLVACPSGQTNCGGACADLQSDPANCGTCGNACVGGEGCFGGACTPLCVTAADCDPALNQPPVCDSPTTCQGTRQDAVCLPDGSCTSQVVDDDSACSAALLADTCGFYPSVFCTGGATQSPPTCATTCVSDLDCDPEAHCDAGSCVADLPLSAPCASGNECQSGFCADGFCCDSACGGTCQSCGLPGTEGTCVLVPAGADPNNDCPSGQVCDGAGACTTPDFSGTWSLTPTVAYSCAGGAVDFSIASVVITDSNPTISINTGAQPGVLTGSFSTPTDFSASNTIAGGCTETYGLSGSFTDANTFTGTFTADYFASDGTSCTIVTPPCTNQSFPVTGTRP